MSYHLIPITFILHLANFVIKNTIFFTNTSQCHHTDFLTVLA